MIEGLFIAMFVGLLMLFGGFRLAILGGRFEIPGTAIAVIGGWVAAISALGFMLSLVMWTVRAWLG